MGGIHVLTTARRHLQMLEMAMVQRLSRPKLYHYQPFFAVVARSEAGHLSGLLGHILCLIVMTLTITTELTMDRLSALESLPRMAKRLPRKTA